MRKPTPEPYPPSRDDEHRENVLIAILGVLLVSVIVYWVHDAYQRKHPAFIEIHNKISEAVAGEGR